jgi:hypothetical protein
MMLVVARGWPLTGAMAVPVLLSEASEVVDAKAVEPDSWLARGALMLIVLFSRATPSADVWKTGAVFVRSRGAWAILCN